MTAIRYIGGHDEVEVPDLGITVKRNHKIDAPDDIAANLVQQDVWELVEAKPAKKKPAKKKASVKPKVEQPDLPPEGANTVSFPIDSPATSADKES